MHRTIIQFSILFVVLTLLQAVCNKIILFNVATPIIFIYILFRLPVNMPKVALYCIAFIMGLIIDIFGNTAGMHALTCTVVSAMRAPVLNMFFSREDEMGSPLPSIETLGMGIYIKYLSTMVIIYCTMLFFIQAFTLHNVLLSIERIVFSSILSVLLLVGIDSLVSTQREKRL